MPTIPEEHRRWWVLVAMGCILGVILLDETVLGVALPTISSDLGLSENAAHWVVNIYLLVLAGLSAAGGRFGDIVGHRAVVTVGLAIFGLASLASGFAPDGTWLIVARGIQGIGAAIIFPSSLAMLTIAFPPNQHGVAIGLYGAIGTVFLAAGPLVGGLFTTLVDWRWIFWVNPPIVVLIAAVVFAAWREPVRQGPKPRIDWPGLALMVAGLGLVVYAIQEGPQLGWTSAEIPILFVLGAAILVTFVLVERRVSQPLIDVRLFRDAAFSGSNVLIFSAQYFKTALFIFGAIYLQDKLGFTAIEAGLALLPAVVPTPLTGAWVGRLTERLGVRKPAIIGSALAVIGLVWVAVFMWTENYFLLLPGFLIWGFAPNLLFVPGLRSITGAVAVEAKGEASGIANASQLIGGTMGMAVSSTLFVTTDTYSSVFIVNAVLMVAVLVVVWRTLPKPG